MQRILVFGVEGVWGLLVDARLEVIRSDGPTPVPANVDAVFIGWYRTGS